MALNDYCSETGSSLTSLLFSVAPDDITEVKCVAVTSNASYVRFSVYVLFV
jgi:hypothetical protein